MKLSFFFFFYCCLFFSFGQNHQLIDTTDYEKRKLLISQFENKNELFNKQIRATYKGKLRREVINFYEEYQNQLNVLIQNKKILFQESFKTYSDSLFQLLSKSNPSIKVKNIKLLLSKNPSPNAFSIGNGTIIANIGLFSFLENEYQLLSVLAHETAHEILEHSNESIIRKSNLNISLSSNNSNVSRYLKSDKYKRGSRSFDMLKNLLYEDGEKRRLNEIQADSLGYIFYKNTNASKKEFIDALATMKKYDSVPAMVLDSTIYKKIFDLPGQPFKPTWTDSEDFNDYNYEFYKDKIDSDSLKDHPEMEQRITKLKSTFSELNNNDSIDIIPSNSFTKLKNIASRAYVENLHYVKEYGLSIYLILKRLETAPDDSYYKKWLGINFNALYDAKKKYQLNRYVDRVVPKEQSKSYKQFLNFIWNLNLSEIKIIADYYNET